MLDPKQTAKGRETVAENETIVAFSLKDTKQKNW